jgi:hypothetical protein
MVISNKNEKELKNSMTEVELRQIQAQREFENIRQNSARYEIGLANDVFARNTRTHKSNILKSVWSCENIQAQKFRKELELSSGSITSEIKDGVTMTRDELELEIQHIEWLKDKEKNLILNEFWQMAQLVGKNNVIKEIVLTEEEFEKFYFEIKQRLLKIGIDLTR